MCVEEISHYVCDIKKRYGWRYHNRQTRQERAEDAQITHALERLRDKRMQDDPLDPFTVLVAILGVLLLGTVALQGITYLIN